MTRRIDIEVTSLRADGSFTWRQAGAKAPKGAATIELLPNGAKIGDVLRADVAIDMDGPAIIALAPLKQRERNVTLLEITGSGREFTPVTEISTNKRNRPARDKAGRTGKGDRRGRRGADGEGTGAGRGAANRGPAREFSPPPPELPKRPKATRLRPGTVHRTAVLEALKPEERVLAEQALDGGIGAVRRAVNKQNDQLVKEGKPKINADALVNVVVELLPRLRQAEWRDSVDAVDSILDTVDLRDLRAIVAKANDPTLLKDSSLNAKREELRAALEKRQAQEMANWSQDLQAAVDVGRIVAALKIAAQPPKAGSILPEDMKARLVALTLDQLTAETSSDRWIVVLEALAFAPIHKDVAPSAIPTRVTPELTATVQRLAPAIPRIAALFGIAVDPKAAMPRPLRNEWRDKKSKRPAAATKKPRQARPVADDAAPVIADSPVDAITQETAN